MKDIWGVEKSFVPGKGFIPITKLPKTEARALARRYSGKGSANRYTSKPLERYDMQVAGTLKANRQQMSQIAGRDLSKKPRGQVELISVEGYPSAHPVIWGRKGEGVYMVGGPAKLGDPQIRRHEMLHAKKSSWRMAQIESDPVKIAREEARADTLSGTHAIRHKPSSGIMSHTKSNRDTARQLDRRFSPSRALTARAFGTTAEELPGAKASRAFVRTQDKIDADGRYGTKAAYQRNRRREVAGQAGRASLLPAGAAGIYGLNRWEEHKHRRGSNGKFVSKSMPDASAVHVLGSGGRLKRVKRKKTLKKVTG